MDMSQINGLAILVAALLCFPVGALWYGPVFGQAWMRAGGLSKEQGKTANMPMIYGTVLVLNLIAATSLSMFIGQEGLAFGVFAGFMTGATFISMALGVIYLFEMRSLKLWLINAGYQTVTFTMMGTVIGAWH